MPAHSKNVSAGYFIHSGNLRAPAGVPKGAQRLWQKIMAETPESQWRAADMPLLQMFVRTAVLADEAVRHLEQGQVDASGKVSPWVKVASDHGKTLALLAAKLRLSPSSRTRPEAHCLQQAPARALWQWGDRDVDPEGLLAR